MRWFSEPFSRSTEWRVKFALLPVPMTVAAHHGEWLWLARYEWRREPTPNMGYKLLRRPFGSEADWLPRRGRPPAPPPPSLSARGDA